MARPRPDPRQLVSASPLPYAIVRPPAVYGPGDKETLELFRMARRGIVLLPPEGRLSLIHADDLGRLLLALADPGGAQGLLVEPDDGRHGGWTHAEFGQALGKALGARVATAVDARARCSILGARIDRLVRRDRAKLTADRVAYFCHPDWMVDPGRGAPAIAVEPGDRDRARAGRYRRTGIAQPAGSSCGHQLVEPPRSAVSTMPSRNKVKLQ